MIYNDLNCFYPCNFKKKVGVISVSGNGSITLKSNLAIVNIGVITEDKNLNIAQTANAEKSNKVVNSLLSEGVGEKDIWTGNYSIDQKYDYVDGKQVFKEYKVSNSLVIRTKDLDKVGNIIDKSVVSGANIVYNVKFTLSNVSFYYNKALNLALKESVLKAHKIGEVLKVVVDKVPYKIEEKSSIPLMDESIGLTFQGSNTKIMPEEIRVSATLEALFYYKF